MIGGYPSEMFLSVPVNSGLTCACCLEILRDPVQCTNGHLFCRTCIGEALRHHTRCPTCRCFLDERQLIVCLLAKQMISAMRIRCVFSKHNDEYGICCKWKGTIQDLDRHLDTDCQLQVVLCGNGGCGESMPRHALMSHKRNQCQMRLVSCPYCAQLHPSASLVSHTFSCLRRPVKCENRCTESCFPFCDMTEHYKCCPYEPLCCPFYSAKCNESCNGWVLRKDWEKHTQDSSNMNIVIRALFEKVERLEGEQQQHHSQHHRGREKRSLSRSRCDIRTGRSNNGAFSAPEWQLLEPSPPLSMDSTVGQSGSGGGRGGGGYIVRTVSARRYIS